MIPISFTLFAGQRLFRLGGPAEAWRGRRDRLLDVFTGRRINYYDMADKIKIHVIVVYLFLCCSWLYAQRALLDSSALPLTRFPSQIMLDTAMISPEWSAMLHTVPEARGSLEWKNPLLLKIGVEYLTGIKANEIPFLIKYLPDTLRSRNFRIFRFGRVQAKALQIILANHIYVLFSANRVKPLVSQGTDEYAPSWDPLAGKRVDIYSEQPFYNVMTGYECFFVNKEKGYEKIHFYFFDDYALSIEPHEFIQTKSWPIFPRNSISNIKMTEMACHVKDVYIIVPSYFTLKAVKKFINASFESVDYSYKIPLIEEVIAAPLGKVEN